MNTVITILAIIVLVIVIIIAISGSRNLRNFRDNMDDRFDKQQNKYIDPDIVYAHNVVMSEAYDRPTYEEVMHCMKQMIDHKNAELRNHEQSLLYTLYSILDGLAVEGEARDIAIEEFKKHLINNDLQ